MVRRTRGSLPVLRRAPRWVEEKTGRAVGGPKPTCCGVNRPAAGWPPECPRRLPSRVHNSALPWGTLERAPRLRRSTGLSKTGAGDPFPPMPLAGAARLQEARHPGLCPDYVARSESVHPRVRTRSRAVFRVGVYAEGKGYPNELCPRVNTPGGNFRQNLPFRRPRLGQP
jgi:hypothetical protein